MLSKKQPTEARFPPTPKGRGLQRANLMNNPILEYVVDSAAAAAVDLLERDFPGFDTSGIRRQFQKELAEQITKMLDQHNLVPSSDE